MSTIRTPMHIHKPAEKPRQNQTLYLIVAVILLLAAGGLVAARVMGTKAEAAKTAEARNPQTQIEQIRKNPNMPAQAKAIAEMQIRARQQETAPRAAGQKR